MIQKVIPYFVNDISVSCFGGIAITNLKDKQNRLDLEYRSRNGIILKNQILTIPANGIIPFQPLVKGIFSIKVTGLYDFAVTSQLKQKQVPTYFKVDYIENDISLEKTISNEDKHLISWPLYNRHYWTFSKSSLERGYNKVQKRHFQALDYISKEFYLMTLLPVGFLDLNNPAGSTDHPNNTHIGYNFDIEYPGGYSSEKTLLNPLYTWILIKRILDLGKDWSIITYTPYLELIFNQMTGEEKRKYISQIDSDKNKKYQHWQHIHVTGGNIGVF